MSVRGGWCPWCLSALDCLKTSSRVSKSKGKRCSGEQVERRGDTVGNKVHRLTDVLLPRSCCTCHVMGSVGSAAGEYSKSKRSRGTEIIVHRNTRCPEESSCYVQHVPPTCNMLAKAATDGQDDSPTTSRTPGNTAVQYNAAIM